MKLTHQDQRQGCGVFARFKNSVAVAGVVEDVLDKAEVFRQNRLSNGQCGHALSAINAYETELV